MRLPSILDLLDAVTRVSRDHGDVRAWWLVPHARLALKGSPSERAQAGRELEIALEVAPGATPDWRRIERELASRLPGAAVTVRAHAGDQEPRQLLRLLSVESIARDGRAVGDEPRSESR